ncbi:MAG: ribonuclease HII [Amoebophilaceae bacterium TMED152]|nr:MAG: ribonuclease HII [Amoebophilaceae bacterium TMED152]
MLKSCYQSKVLEVGCDEVGRGCIAGPVVAASVIFPNNYSNESIKDSKTISPKKRILIEKEIKSSAIAWSVSEIDSKRIDRENILNASISAMHAALDNLRIIPKYIIVDGNKFKKYKDIEHRCIIKGDSKYLSIAAASIIAKNYRDQLMKKLSEKHNQYDWHKNFGYPTKSHRDAIKKFGITDLHRKSFKLI